LDLINKAIELNKANADFYIQKGDILVQMGDKEIAYSFYLKGLEINPNNIDGYG
jgi:tetratricopeptide (TPR) repeat protein